MRFGESGSIIQQARADVAALELAQQQELEQAKLAMQQTQSEQELAFRREQAATKEKYMKYAMYAAVAFIILKAIK